MSFARLFALWFVAASLIWGGSALSQLSLTGAGSTGTVSGGFTPTCAQSTSFIARTSGLSNGVKTAYDTFICGLVADAPGLGCTTSLWNCFDAIYVFATTDTTTAQLSLVSATYNASLVNAPTFAAGGGGTGGYTGNGTNSYINSNFNPSSASGNFVQDNASHFIWSNTAAADASGNIACDGTQTLVGKVFLYPRTNAGAAFFGTQDDATYTTTTASANGSGLFAAERINSTTETGYRNGSQIATAAVTSTAEPNDVLVFGTGDGTFCVRQLMAAGIGASLGTTGHAAFYARMHTLLQTLAGIP